MLSGGAAGPTGPSGPPGPGPRAAVLSKQEMPRIRFDLGQSLLCLLSVENESAFHRLLSKQQIDAEAAPRLWFLQVVLEPVLLCGETLAGRAGRKQVACFRGG